MVSSSSGGREPHRPMRIVLAGGPVRARDALRDLLVTEAGIEVIAAASTLHGLGSALAAPPDLALVDVRLPDVDAILASRDFRQQSPASRILLFSTHADAGTVAAVTVSSASGYVQKTLDTGALAAVLTDAARGRRDEVARQVTASVVRWVESGLAGESARGASPLAHDLDVLRLVATGHTDGEISEQLNLDAVTTRARVAQLYLDLHSASAFRGVGSDLARLLL